MHPSPRPRPTIRILAAAFLLLVLSYSCSHKNAAPANTGQTGGMVSYTGTFINHGSPDTSTATGLVTATFDPTTLTLTYSISWSSLTSLPIMMHFHDNGPVIVTITGWPVAQTGTVSGTCKFTSAQATDLVNGGIYAMIHTVNYSAGEIYAPLVKN
ncbi:MAG TPA: CHRD domain-containing protein [Puia sp.]|nr:CHRD domain-containing protein [Puia sp.]